MDGYDGSNASEAKTPTNWTSQGNTNLFADQSNYNYGTASDAADNGDYSPAKGQEAEKKDILPANPLLPKVIHPEQKEPPQCPLKDIQFVQIQKFRRFKQQILARMGDGYDQVGKKNMMRENREKRKQYDQNKRGEDEQEAKMDEYTHIIQNIVYARDPKIFDTKSGFVNQRNAFQHENMLDIKGLIRSNEERSGGAEGFGVRRPPPPKKIVKSKKELEYEKELEAKARYKVRTLDNGEVDRTDKTMLFESRFESGNLYLAQKVSDSEYNLLMQNDINTSGHTQWFFFRVQNTRRNSTCAFNIMNFTKPDSLFNFGMKVSVYSEKMAGGAYDDHGNEVPPDQIDPDGGRGWFKGGERISYYQNGIKKDPINYCSKGYYTLSFSYKFLHDDDTVFFAYCFPYTYTDLMHDIYEIESDPARRAICTRKTLCKTLAGNDCEVLTITEKGDFAAMQAKQAVIISARVHPGEVVGSWMMRGVMDFLTDVDNPEAKMLREKFIFKIIPMLNPDGVINGNYRCSLAGCDLNRRWKVPHKNLHPTIWATKRLIKDLHYERGLLLYCDLHGHSRKQNVFMYGCNNKLKPEECRVFPLMLSKLSKFFHFGSCRFGVQKSKEQTARVSLYKELKTCPNIFTMESTFSGADFGEHKGQHMKQSHFEEMGRDLCRTLLIYGNIFVPPELEHLFPSLTKGDDKVGDLGALFTQELASNKKLMDAGDGDSSGGSDSEPSEDNLPVEEVAKVVPIVDKSQKMQLQKIMRKKLQDEKDAEKKRQLDLLNKKKEEPPTRSPSPRERRQLKPAAKPFELKPSETDKKAEKKKPEMKDACTQTERCDYKRIKQQYLDKQKREKQEYRENIARQNNAPYKSSNGLVDPLAQQQVRKNLQSQTGAHRESSHAQSPKKLGGGGHQGTDFLQQDLRYQQRYQINMAHQPATDGNQHMPSTSGDAQRVPFQNQMLQSRAGQLGNQSGSNLAAAPVPFPQGNGLHVKTSMPTNIPNSMIGSPNKGGPPQMVPGGAPQQPTQQQLTNFSQALAIQQPYQNGTAQNQNRNRNARTHQAAFGGSTPSKSESQGGIDPDADRRVMKGPSSTMSKAGEQILQAAAPQAHLNTNSHGGLHQTPGSVQKNQHFGAIHLGGGMSFLKDQKGNPIMNHQGKQQVNVAASGQLPVGMRKGVDGQLIKTASRGRGGTEVIPFNMTASNAAESTHSVKGGDASAVGNSGMVHLKQASQIASNFVPQQHQQLHTSPDMIAQRRGFSVQLAAGSPAPSPERRQAQTEAARKDMTMSLIERKEMESIQLFQAQNHQPIAHSRMAENIQPTPIQLPRGYATAAAKPNVGAASFDHRALVKPGTTEINQEKFQQQQQRLGHAARGSIDSHGRPMVQGITSGGYVQHQSPNKPYERQLLASSQPISGNPSQAHPFVSSAARRKEETSGHSATVPRQFFKYAPVSGENTTVEGHRVLAGRATPPFHSSTAKSAHRPHQSPVFRIDSNNPSQKLLQGINTGSTASKDMTQPHGISNGTRGDSNFEEYSERDRFGRNNKRNELSHKKNLSVIVGSGNHVTGNQHTPFQSQVGIVGVSAFASQSTGPNQATPLLNPHQSPKSNQLVARNAKRQSQGNFTLTSQVYGVNGKGSHVVAQYNTQSAAAHDQRNVQAQNQHQLQLQQQMVGNASYNANQNASKRMAPQMGLSAEHSPALRQVRMNIGGANVANTLRQSSTNMGKLGPNQQK